MTKPAAYNNSKVYEEYQRTDFRKFNEGFIDHYVTYQMFLKDHGIISTEMNCSILDEQLLVSSEIDQRVDQEQKEKEYIMQSRHSMRHDFGVYVNRIENRIRKVQ